MKMISILATASALALAAPATAAELSPAVAGGLARAASPDAASVIGTPSTGISLTAGSEATSVVLAFSISRQETGDKLGASDFTVRFSAPLNKDTKEGNFLAGGAPSAGTSAELVWSGIYLRGHFGIQDSATSIAAKARAVQNCHVVFKDQSSEWPAKCDKKTFKALHADHYVADEDWTALNDSAFLNAPIVVWKVAANVGTDSHSFRDPVTFKSDSVDHTSYGMSASLGREVRLTGTPAGFYWGVGGEHQVDYTDAGKRNLCHATATAGVSECFTSSFAGPTRNETSDVFGLLRWLPAPDANLIGLKGVEAKLAYDFENHVTGLGTSLYLFADKDGRATGGVRLTWKSDDNDPTTKDRNFTVGAFIGVPLQIF